MNVRLLPTALADLDDIWSFTAGRWGETLAEQYVRDIDAAFGLLAGNGKIGVKIDFIRPGYRKLIVRSHVIFYRTTLETLEVVRILHQSRDVENLLD